MADSYLSYASTAEYLIVTLTEGAHSTRAEVPVNGYFNAAFISSQGTGDLVTFNTTLSDSQRRIPLKTDGEF